MEKLVKKHAEKFRYLLVGGFNTALDFILLFLFVALGVDKIVANFFSTGIAMVISFFINKSFTFKDSGENKRRQFAIFMAVTVVGMWVIQPLLIWAVTSTLPEVISNTLILLFIAKVIATGASLVWNYIMYSRFVFKNRAVQGKEV